MTINLLSRTTNALGELSFGVWEGNHFAWLVYHGTSVECCWIRLSLERLAFSLLFSTHSLTYTIHKQLSSIFLNIMLLYVFIIVLFRSVPISSNRYIFSNNKMYTFIQVGNLCILNISPKFSTIHIQMTWHDFIWWFTQSCIAGFTE